MRDDNCIFCKLANGVFPTNSIYEDDDFNVIIVHEATKVLYDEDGNPYADWSTIINSKEEP